MSNEIGVGPLDAPAAFAIVCVETVNLAQSTWFLRPKPAADARVRLFCFPYAGRGASMYARWWEHLPAEVEVQGVQLPGRENRLAEPLATDLLATASHVASLLAPQLDRPFAFFGHSMGALLAFETARALRRRGYREPGRLILSGYRAPHFPNGAAGLPGLPDLELIAELQRKYGGIPSFVIEDPELRALYLRVIRADLHMLENYVFAPEQPLACGISAFGGEGDAMVDPAVLEGWRSQTRSSFDLRMFPGDHFFVASNSRMVLSAVAETLRQLC